MKNRAKCKLCNDILESFHRYDYVSCKCGEISISGGADKFECSAKSWNNFLRVDDEGNEIIPTIKDGSDDPEKKPEEQALLNEVDFIEMLEAMVKNLQNLPPQALSLPITHFDLFSHMAVVLAILKRQKNN